MQHSVVAYCQREMLIFYFLGVVYYVAQAEAAIGRTLNICHMLHGSISNVN